MNCVWGVWDQWGGCSKNCGGGQQSRSRTKITPQSNGGSCQGSGSENQPCNTQKCGGGKCCMLGVICGIMGKCLNIGWNMLSVKDRVISVQAYCISFLMIWMTYKSILFLNITRGINWNTYQFDLFDIYVMNFLN